MSKYTVQEAGTTERGQPTGAAQGFRFHLATGSFGRFEPTQATLLGRPGGALRFWNASPLCYLGACVHRITRQNPSPRCLRLSAAAITHFISCVTQIYFDRRSQAMAAFEKDGKSMSAHLQERYISLTKLHTPVLLAYPPLSV